DHRRASWTRNTVRGPQTLYYKLEVTEKLEKVLPADSPLDEEIVQPVWTQVEKVAAESLIRSARELSADPGSFTLQLLKMMSGQSASQDALLLQQTSGGQSTAQLAFKLLAEAGITARMVRGIYLENRLYNQKADELVEIHDGSQWLVFDPRSASQGVPENFFMWQRG